MATLCVKHCGVSFGTGPAEALEIADSVCRSSFLLQRRCQLRRWRCRCWFGYQGGVKRIGLLLLQNLFMERLDVKGVGPDIAQQLLRQRPLDLLEEWIGNDVFEFGAAAAQLFKEMRGHQRAIAVKEQRAAPS